MTRIEVDLVENGFIVTTWEDGLPRERRVYETAFAASSDVRVRLYAHSARIAPPPTEEELALGGGES